MGKELIYSYEGNIKEITSESMTYGDKELISRNATRSLVNGKNVNPPQNKLVIQTQRDTTKFPEFEIVMSWAEHTRQFKMITLSEDEVIIPLFSSYMSNGMLRVFYILTYMAYVATVEGAKTFLVDDLGEGLDYSRSSKLSKIMFDYCEAHDIQLIVTSNDNFLMNAISLDNWSVRVKKLMVTAVILILICL